MYLSNRLSILKLVDSLYKLTKINELIHVLIKKYQRFILSETN